MKRRYDMLGRRILALLETGPRKITVLLFMAPEEKLRATLERLIQDGRVVKLQKPRLGGTHYALKPQ